MMSRERWLSTLSPALRDEVRGRMTTIDLPAGAVLHHAGERASGLYEVERGYLKLLGLNPDGRQVLIVLYRPGNCFCEAPLVSQRPLSHTTQALTDVRVRCLPERAFWTLFEQHREIPDALCRKLAGTSSRLFTARERRSTLRLRQLLADCFRALARQCGVPRADGSILIDLPLVQTDFAEFLEVTRQAVQREIGTFKAAGLVTQQRDQWVVHDLARLG